MDEEKLPPEIIRYEITGETEEEITDQLNKLELDLIKRFGKQADSAKEVMTFVSSLRESVFKKLKQEHKLTNDPVSFEKKEKKVPN